MTPKSANQSSEERANGDLAWPDLARSSILIVDDEPGMRSFLVRALRPRCKAVEAAADTIEAEQHLTERHFDIVIVDKCCQRRVASRGWRTSAGEGSWPTSF